MCGSNTAGEAMPLYVMFSSDAKVTQNYAVKAVRIFALPHVTSKFVHDQEKSFPVSVTTNKGKLMVTFCGNCCSTMSRLLSRCLIHPWKAIAFQERWRA
jgi:hypothetical protein